MERVDFGPVFSSQTEAMQLPGLVRLRGNLVAAVFRLMKLLPARYVVKKAFDEGRIDPKLGIVETSSGTYALGLGMICAELGIPFHIVSDPAIDEVLKGRLEELGGRVTIVSKDYAGANLQVQRLAVVRAHLAEHPGTFWPCQYHNPENREAYRLVADQFRARLGSDLILVGTVGSGGSSGGIAEFMREAGAQVRLVGVDTFGSVLFGLPNGRRVLRGLGNSLQPDNLHHALYDEIHWVSAEEGYYQTRRLHRETSLYMGPTSGAAYMVAEWVARQNPSKTVVFIAADEGYRYATTVYNDAWLEAEGLLCPNPCAEPRHFDHLGEVKPPWASYTWGRRSLSQALETSHSTPSGS